MQRSPILKRINKVKQYNSFTFSQQLFNNKNNNLFVGKKSNHEFIIKDKKGGPLLRKKKNKNKNKNRRREFYGFVIFFTFSPESDGR
jgi:hypothetical protein